MSSCITKPWGLDSAAGEKKQTKKKQTHTRGVFNENTCIKKTSKLGKNTEIQKAYILIQTVIPHNSDHHTASWHQNICLLSGKGVKNKLIFRI